MSLNKQEGAIQKEHLDKDFKEGQIASKDSAFVVIQEMQVKTKYR